MDKSFEKIFDEVIESINYGTVEIGELFYNINFHTVIHDSVNQSFSDDIPVLIVRDKQRILTMLMTYIERVIRHTNRSLDEQTIKEYICFLFANGGYEDFRTPEKFIERYTNFFDNPIKPNRLKEVDFFDQSDIVVDNLVQSFHQETPYALNIKLEKTIGDEKVEYKLPKISYGISDDICYICAIQNDISKEEPTPSNLKYQKKIKRLLYKINDGVINFESDEYLKHKNNLDTYCPENISEVSPSAILALTILFNELRKSGISDVKILSFMPIRYTAKQTAILKKINYKVKYKNLSEEESNSLLEELTTEHSIIQDNLTQKLLRNFKRLEFHFNNVLVHTTPFEVDEFMTVKVDDFNYTDNPLLNDILIKYKENVNDKNKSFR